MKVTCSVEVVKRFGNTSNLKKKKAAVATLALCRKPRAKDQHTDKNVFLIICTHQNLRGTKYKVYNNIDKLCTKHINEGKAILHFKEPAYNIFISKADPLQLKGFLHGVGQTLVGQGTGKIRLSPTPMEVDRPEFKLSIMQRKRYPMKSGFPSNLTWLQVRHCKLKKIDARILQLDNLQVLDLAHNLIKELPLAMSTLRIKELVLNHNEIVEFPNELALGTLGQSLHVLDLSFNKVLKISPYFCLMKNISVLQLKHNMLSVLPRNMHSLESLKVFSASYNSLKVLPFGIKKLQLDNLDLVHNPLDTNADPKPVTPWLVPSLMECAAFSVVTKDVTYNYKDIPTVVNDYVTEHCHCPCGKLVFRQQFSCILVLDLCKLASTVGYINNTSRFKVPLEVYFCSTKCWKKFFN